MDRKLFTQIKQHWQYLPLPIRVITTIDYYLRKIIEGLQAEFNELTKAKNLKFFYWLPRILGLSFVIFLCSLALDAFTGNISLSLMLNSASAKLIPGLILSLLLLIAWKYEILGGALFISLFIIIYALIIRPNPLPADLLFFVPILLIGSLFLIDSYLRRPPKQSH